MIENGYQQILITGTDAENWQHELLRLPMFVQAEPAAYLLKKFQN